MFSPLSGLHMWNIYSRWHRFYVFANIIYFPGERSDLNAYYLCDEQHISVYICAQCIQMMRSLWEVWPWLLCVLEHFRCSRMQSRASWLIVCAFDYEYIV